MVLQESAVSLLTKESKKSSDGRKKQKLGCDRFDKLQLATFESVLASLEVSLRWDAHNGGAWIREMDSQRFDALLRPLGKLIQCHLPSNQPNALYDRIVRGMSSSCGSVVGCIVALASAAGDEQLWKPLNHVVLQACSNRSRAEVRKAGVFCLFSLVKCIGEEYMVLIPECLPVLAELLEDSDEEVAGLAQDCIALSEELLGESLQDSLL
jgi:U3 small nucleolar RNA-associated protein 10